MKSKKPKRSDVLLGELIILRIKQIRHTHAHTQECVHENTGLDIAHIEIGRAIPSVVSLSAFCRFYNMTLDEFFAPMSYPPKQ